MKKSLLRNTFYALALTLLTLGMVSWLGGCGDNIVKPETVAPSQPTNVRVTHMDSTTVDLAWTASTDNLVVCSYNVYRGAILAGNTQDTTFHDTDLNPGTTYIYTVEATDCFRNASVRSDAVTATTLGPTDITRPTVLSTIPIDGDTINGNIGVVLINATFSEPMRPSSINSESFTVESIDESSMAGVASPVPGVVSYDVVNHRASFVPSSNLALSTNFTATITTIAVDVAGNALASDYVWHFSTLSEAADTTRPTVLSTIPIDGDTINGNIGVVHINATFSEAMMPSTINSQSFTVTGPGSTPVAGVVSYDIGNRRGSFVPSSNLALSTRFTATITTLAADRSGNTLAANHVWHFTTLSGAADTTRPTVLSTIPIDGDTVNGAIGVLINATFSEAMMSSSINSLSFTVTGPGTSPVAGVVSYDVANRRGSFAPTNNLPVSTLFTATITTLAADRAGNRMASNYVWHFSTFAHQSEQQRVDLLSCEGFAVIAGSAITNTGPTHITGDVGLSPGSSISGFPPGIIVGTLHVDDPTAAQAKLDLTTAYNDAAGRTLNPITLSGNIGGTTLAPGLYKSTSSLEISSGDLTLDGGGNADAVWIFQIASTFTTTTGRAVILSGNANPNNIFWQVGTSATLGVNSIFKGIILSDQLITMNTGATLDGRVLTRIAAVTLDNNTIVKPLP